MFEIEIGRVESKLLDKSLREKCKGNAMVIVFTSIQMANFLKLKEGC